MILNLFSVFCHMGTRSIVENLVISYHTNKKQIKGEERLWLF